MPEFVTWLLFALVLLALLWWVRALRRQLQLADHRIVQLQRKAAALDEEVHDVRMIVEALADVSPEALLLVDRRRRIMTMNPVARSVFGGEAGRSVIETTRSHEIHQLVIDTLESDTRLARQIAVDGRVLRARTAPIAEIGVAVSLQDVTELGRLARARRDMVSNISHELRTPLTSIKGFVENHLNGAMEDPQTCRRFLEIIDGETNRLVKLTEDLLDLWTTRRSDAGYSRRSKPR